MAQTHETIEISEMFAKTSIDGNEGKLYKQ